MLRTLIVVSCSLAFFGLVAQSSHAELYHQVPIRGGDILVPDGLEVGDTFRLFFVTQEFFSAAGTVDDQGLLTYKLNTDFDAEVKSQADQIGSLMPGLDWEAIVTARDSQSGSFVNAVDRSDQDGHAVYGTGGAMVAADYQGLFSSGSSGPGTRELNQFGETVGVGQFVWSGSLDSGVVGVLGSGTPTYLGQAPDAIGTYGSSGQEFHMWLDAYLGQDPLPGLELTQDVALRLYGVSEVLEVVIPEPGTLTLWIGFLGSAGLFFWRKLARGSK